MMMMTTMMMIAMYFGVCDYNAYTPAFSALSFHHTFSTLQKRMISKTAVSTAMLMLSKMYFLKVFAVQRFTHSNYQQPYY